MQEFSKRCEAMTGSGTPCRRFPILGGTRCTLHGGGTPQARRVAQEMLAIARVPAVRVLLQIVEDFTGDRCEACGRPSGDPGPAIRAATAVLDRAGLHPTLAVEAAPPSNPDPWTNWLTDEQLAQVAQWMAEAKRRMLAGQPKPVPRLAAPATEEVRVVDGEVDVTEPTVHLALVAEPRGDSPEAERKLLFGNWLPVSQEDTSDVPNS